MRRGPMSSRVGLLLLLVGLALDGRCTAIDVDEDRTTYEVKLGFIPGTKPDVDTGFMTVDQAKVACEKKSECLGFTMREAPDVKGSVHVYFKADTSVTESDKTWSSFVKRPAGLMDVTFSNNLTFPLELCWIDMVGTAAPVCYGTVHPGASKTMQVSCVACVHTHSTQTHMTDASFAGLAPHRVSRGTTSCSSAWFGA